MENASNEIASSSTAYNALCKRVGKTSVQFEPVGTFLMGTRGRVQVTGPAANAALVLVSKEARD